MHRPGVDNLELNLTLTEMVLSFSLPNSKTLPLQKQKLICVYAKLKRNRTDNEFQSQLGIIGLH